MTDILWFIIEIAVNIYQGFLCSYFVLKFLTPKNNTNNKTYYLLSGGTQAILVTTFNHITIFESIASILYFLGLFIFAFFMLNGNIIKKVFASILPLLTGFIITILVLNLISSTNQMTIPEIVTSRGTIRIITLLIIQLLYYFSFKILLKIFRTDNQKFSIYDWSFVIAVMLSSILLISLLHTIAINSINQEQRLYISFGILILLVLNILSYNLIGLLIKKNHELRELEMLKLQERYQQQFIENATIQYDSIKKIRHDLKNKFQTVHQLITKGDINSALSFVSQNQNLLENAETYMNTNNQIVNAIVNSKLSSASAMGIQVTCLSVENFEGIDNIDLCDLLSNTLDNAISACLYNIKNHNEISLSIIFENDVYTFLVKNTIAKSVLDENPNLLTTKKDKTEHGYGTQIIKDIAYKYNGRYDFYEKNNMFICQVILKAKS